LNDVRASLEQQGKTPFLGSVVTEMRETVLEHDTQIDPEVLPVEPIESREAANVAAAVDTDAAVVDAAVVDAAVLEDPIPSAPVVESPATGLSDTCEPVAQQPAALCVPLDHTPPWQPNVAPLPPLPQPALARSHEVTAPPSADPVAGAGRDVIAEPPPIQEVAQEAAQEAAQDLEADAVEDASQHSPLAEAEGFFLLLDEAGSSKPPTVATVEHTQLIGLARPESDEAFEQDAAELDDEVPPEMFATDSQDESELPPEESESPPEEQVPAATASKPPLYQPQRSDLASLFAELEQPRFEQDVGYELKLMAGIEASASSQTPPPVGFSEVNEAVPTPADPADDEAPASSVLARAKGVGLATLTGLGVAFLLLRAPQAAPPVERSLASGAPARCTASVQVVDAPSDAEIRVRAPAPNARFSPLAAHGSAALFPQLPCGTSLEVMVRDSAKPESSWAVIPIAPDELTARTGQVPLRISARPEDRINP
jgi:hypothetical protein